MNLERALQIAVTAHAGQKDRNGQPYIFHPIRVMGRTQSDQGKIVALLHDVVEDTAVTLDELTEEGFSAEVIAALTLLTHAPEVPYEDYIEAIASNPLAIEVKLADLSDNSDIFRLDALKPKDLARLERYHRAWVRLRAAR